MSDQNDKNDSGSNDWASGGSDWSAAGADEFEVEVVRDFDNPQEKAAHLRRMIAAKSGQSGESSSKVHCTECG